MQSTTTPAELVEAMEEVVVEVTEMAEVVTTAVTTTTSSNPTSCLHTTSQCVTKS